MTTYFISGHRNITNEEWEKYYVPRIIQAIEEPDARFVIGDYHGVDMIAQQFLFDKGITNVIVYHMFDNPRNNAGFPTCGGFETDEERDASMTNNSDIDIAWVREGAYHSGTAQNLKRRLNKIYEQRFSIKR